MLNKKFFLITIILLCGKSSFTMENNSNAPAVTTGAALNTSSDTTSQPTTQTNSTQASGATDATPPAPSSAPVDSRTNLEKLDEKLDHGIDWVKGHPIPSIVGGLVSSAIFCKLFPNFIKNQQLKFRALVERKVLDVLIKWEEIKEYGLTTKDYIKGLTTLLITGGAGYALYHSDVNDLKSYLMKALQLLRTYKIQCGSVFLGALIMKWIIDQKEAFERSRNNRLNFDKFLGQLSDEQRRSIFNSDDLLLDVAKGSDNYNRLLNNENFMKLLSETQKNYLENIVRYRTAGILTE